MVWLYKPGNGCNESAINTVKRKQQKSYSAKVAAEWIVVLS
jgi:hypothetical protein